MVGHRASTEDTGETEKGVEDVELTETDDLSEILDQARYGELPTPTQETIANAVCRRLGLRSLVIRKHKGDPPIFHMVANGCDGSIGRVAEITSQTKFRNRVAECCGHWALKIPRQQWEECVQSILDIAEEIDLGDASHPRRQTTEQLREYLVQYFVRPEADKDQAAQARQPFWYHGSAWISARDYGKWLVRSVGDVLTHREICSSFHMLGMEPKTIHFYADKGKKGKERRTSGQFWQITSDIGVELGISEEKS